MLKNKDINDNKKKLEKIFNQYKINLIPETDSITILVQNSNYIYESNFNLEFLHKYKLLISSLSIQELIDFISGLIDQKNIEIEDNIINLKLILISTLYNHPNVELFLSQKNLSQEVNIIELTKEIEYLKEENKSIKENFKNEYDKLNKKIEFILKENNEIKQILKKKTEQFEKEINNNKEEIKSLKNVIINKLKVSENSNKNEKKDKQLEKNNFQTTNFNLTKIKSFKIHNDTINSISCFPSGNIISVSNDCSIKIYDINLYLLQDIKNAHDKGINYVDIKDENNFITCSSEGNIHTWIKKENKFTLDKIIKHAHDNIITKAIYYQNKIISCSWDKIIKIWEIKNKNYQNIKNLINSEWVSTILLLEDKKILVSAGFDGTKFWDLNNYTLLNYFSKTYCGWFNELCRIDEDKIIVKGKNTLVLKVISIKEKTIIKEINLEFECYGINTIKNNGIFLIGGKSKDIKVYRIDNYECIQIIKGAHYNDINGFTELTDRKILSYGDNNEINIWQF